MGSVSMTVIGVGAHHNHAEKVNDRIPHDERYPDKPNRTQSRIPDQDANKLFEEFVDKLRSVGFSVEHASFTHGGREYP